MSRKLIELIEIAAVAAVIGLTAWLLTDPAVLAAIGALR